MARRGFSVAKKSRAERGKKVFTIEFLEPAAASLEELAADYQTSKSNVIRNALTLYARLSRELAPEGRDLAILNGTEVERIIVVPGFPR